MEGKVKFFNNSKGFGFVVADDGTDYFVHITGLAEGVTVRDHDRVVFDVEQGQRGPKAVNVRLATGDAAPAEQPQEEASEEMPEEAASEEAPEAESGEDDSATEEEPQQE